MCESRRHGGPTVVVRRQRAPSYFSREDKTTCPRRKGRIQSGSRYPAWSSGSKTRPATADADAWRATGYWPRPTAVAGGCQDVGAGRFCLLSLFAAEIAGFFCCGHSLRR